MKKDLLLEILERGVVLPNSFLQLTSEEEDIFLNSKFPDEMIELIRVMDKIKDKKEIIEVASKVDKKSIIEDAIYYLRFVNTLYVEYEEYRVIENLLNILNSKNEKLSSITLEYLMNWTKYYCNEDHDKKEEYDKACEISKIITQTKINSKKYKNIINSENIIRNVYHRKPCNPRYLSLLLNAKNTSILQEIKNIKHTLSFYGFSEEDELRTEELILETTKETEEVFIKCFKFIQNENNGIFLDLLIDLKKYGVDYYEILKYIATSKSKDSAEYIVKIISYIANKIEQLEKSQSVNKQEIKDYLNKVVEGIKIISHTENKKIVEMISNIIEKGISISGSCNLSFINKMSDFYEEITKIDSKKTNNTDALKALIDKLYYDYRYNIDLIIPLIKDFNSYETDSSGKVFFNKSTLDNKYSYILEILKFLIEETNLNNNDKNKEQTKYQVVYACTEILFSNKGIFEQPDSFELKKQISKELLNRNNIEISVYILVVLSYLDRTSKLNYEQIIEIVKIITSAKEPIQAKLASIYLLNWICGNELDYEGLKTIMKKLKTYSEGNKIQLTEEEEKIIEDSGIFFTVLDKIICDNMLLPEIFENTYLPDYIEGKLPYSFSRLILTGDNEFQLLATKALPHGADTRDYYNGKARVLLKERPRKK